MMRLWRDRSIRFRPDRRRPDDWSDVHDRARSLAAERLSEPLGAADAAWLAEHLDACSSCREAAIAYERQREALRALARPEPPRDLWARTAAALDREAARTMAGARSGRRRGETGRGAADRSPLGRVVPYGALAGVLVVAVVVGASLLARRTPPVLTASPEPLPEASVPMATPIAVPAGPVAWLERRDDGTYALAVASVGEVCPGPNGVDCPPIAPPKEITLALSDEPRVVVRSPTSDRLVVVVSGDSGGRVLVVPVPSPTPTPSVSSEPSSTPEPSATPSFGTPVPSPSPTPSPTPTPSATQSDGRSSSRPTPGSSPSPTPETTTPAPTKPPASPAASPEPSSSASPEVTPSASVEATPQPVEPMAILDGVSVVGQTAAWSASGRWFAFSARPSTGFEGSNVYIWSPGEARARLLTTDGRSVFSAWLGEWVVGSRVEARTEAVPSGAIVGTGRPFLLDPETGREEPVDVLDMWRPVVDPTGRWAVYWYGSLRLADDGLAWLPDAGALVLGPWPVGVPSDAFGSETAADAGSRQEGRKAMPAEGNEAEPSGSPRASSSPAATEPASGRSSPPSSESSPSPSPSPSATFSPSPTASAQPSPGASDLGLPEGLTPIALGPLRDWDVRWDPTGIHFAIWVADGVDASIGRLSLFTIDPTTGALDPTGVGFRDEPSLPGFSLGLGRLAWAVPPGQGGEPSHVRVLAWTETGVGSVVSQPGTGTVPVIVVR